MEQEIKETIVKKIDKKDINELYRDEDIKEAAIIIKNGGLVAFPTETVYGLGANALMPEAAKKDLCRKGQAERQSVDSAYFKNGRCERYCK